MSLSILLCCVFNTLTFSLLTLKLLWRRSSFCWFDKYSTTGLCIWWFLLFLVKPFVFVAALVILPLNISSWSTFHSTFCVTAVGRHFWFWFYKLESVMALPVSFVYIFEDVISFCLWFEDDKVMITWCFCSTETSDMLNFFAAEYIVNFIIHCYWFCQIFGMNLFVFLFS